jgi:hypothetical protein
MKPKKFLKLVAIAAVTASFAVGCATESETMETTMVEEECMGATAEVKNAIYAAKLKNARARNLGFEWRDTAKLIESAQKAADECDNVRAKALADEAEQQASAAIAQFHADQEMVVVVVVEESMSYLVVSGDNLWSIAGQSGVYGNPYQWPLIYKANSGQIKDADLIFAGQFFDIPQAMDSEVAAAIEHARTRGAWVLGETEASDLDYLSQ